MSMYGRDYIMKLMQLPGQVENLQQDDAEELFSEFATKLIAGENLSDDEKKYMDTYMKDYYTRHIGGSLYPYPKYDAKLKPIYKDLSDYYLKNIDKINYNGGIFLLFYHLTRMAKEYKIRPAVAVKDATNFKPGTRAYHTYDRDGFGNLITQLDFNLDSVKSAIENGRIADLINYGFHELEHEVQHLLVDNQELTNPQALLWAKELLARAIDESYYDEYYAQTFMERDARDVAKNRTIKIFEENGKTTNLSPFLCENAKYDPNIKFRSKELGQIVAIDLLDSITTKAIKDRPHILEELPVLKNVYNPNGDKKTFIQIKTEIFAKMNAEIKEHPNMNIPIRVKYYRLLDGIVDTDNNLKLQKYADHITISKQNGNQKEVDEGKLNIEKLMRERDFSYMEFTTSYKKRISELSNKANKQGLTPDEKVAILKELNQTRDLLNTMLSYNSKFEEEHKKEIEFSKSIDNIRRLLKTTPSAYNFIASEKEIRAVPKTEEELTEDFEKYSKIIIEKASSPEDAEKNINFLQEYYAKLRNDLKNATKKNTS